MGISKKAEMQEYIWSYKTIICFFEVQVAGKKIGLESASDLACYSYAYIG